MVCNRSDGGAQSHGRPYAAIDPARKELPTISALGRVIDRFVTLRRNADELKEVVS